jgi:hypothetical protein
MSMPKRARADLTDDLNVAVIYVESDTVVVHSTDALIDALSNGEVVAALALADDPDDWLVPALARWAASVRAER